MDFRKKEHRDVYQRALVIFFKQYFGSSFTSLDGTRRHSLITKGRNDANDQHTGY